jgi:tetratricopeptide (TPR) repeat protein
MAKPMLVTLPFALLLMDIWPLNRLTLAWPLTLSQRSVAMRLIREKLPLLGLAAILSIITYLAQKLTGAVVDITHVSLPFRLGNALLSYDIYIRQMFWPTRLALFYPYPKSLVAWQVLASAVMLIVVTGLAVGSARKRPYFLVGWLWYLGTLVPVIGFIQAGDQAHADRFMYVPIIGLFIIIAWAIPEISERNRVFAAVAGASALIAICTVVARIQVGHWQSKISIWEHALAVADESYIAHTNLGIALYETGKLDESIQHYQSALRVRPDFAEAHNDLGVALADKGQIDGAINEFLAGLRAKPKQAASHYNVAVLLESRGNIPTAIEHLEAALRLEPGYVDARRELDKLRGANANRR